MIPRTAWEHRAHRVAVREAIAAYVRVHGHKRGLALAAQRIGMGERAARHAYEDESFAADAERAARADDARLTLLREQIARLQAEADAIGARDVGMDRPALDGACDVLRGAGRGMLSTGEEVAR